MWTTVVRESLGWLKVFNALLKGKRRSPSLKERKDVLERQAGCCALCGKEGPLEFDHAPPMRQLVAGAPHTFRGLCRPCHQDITQAQSGGVSLESHFNRRAWNEYVESARPPLSSFNRKGQELRTLQTARLT